MEETREEEMDGGTGKSVQTIQIVDGNTFCLDHDSPSSIWLQCQ